MLRDDLPTRQERRSQSQHLTVSAQPIESRGVRVCAVFTDAAHGSVGSANVLGQLLQSQAIKFVKGKRAKQLNSALQMIGSSPELLEYFRISTDSERRVR